MKTFFSLMIFCSITLLHAQTETAFYPESETEELVIHNRILAKVGDKTISVVDVMKKMDLFLQKNYPHLAGSKLAKFQFYSSQWREYLTQMIDSELMIADAEKLEVKVTDADVREEILNRFGPSIMTTLDSIGLTYEEAKKMIRDEMIVQRMTWFRINSKALQSVNSQDVKKAYQEYCEKNPEMQQWEYQVLSIRSPDKSASEALAAKAFDLLNAKRHLLDVATELKTPDSVTTVSLSEDIQADEKSISDSHKKVLATLTENTFSAPIAQVSRMDHSVVYRIFYLKKHSQTKLPSFEKMAEQLKDQLLQNAANKEGGQYIVKLREKMGYDEKYMMLPPDFQPFVLVPK